MYTSLSLSIYIYIEREIQYPIRITARAHAAVNMHTVTNLGWRN